MKHLGHFLHTRKWEDAFLKQRRGLSSRQKRLKLFNIGSKDIVLDIGCGDGLDILVMEKMGVKNITGIDISRRLLHLAQKTNPQAKFYLAEVDKLPFEKNKFTIVFVDSVFHHLLRYEKSLLEIKRVLKPGGFLCFIEPHQSFIRRVLDFTCKLPLSNYLPGLKQRRVGYLEEKELMEHWLETEEEFYNLLQKLGFRKILFKIDFLSMVAKYQIYH